MKTLNKHLWEEVKIEDCVDHIEVNDRNPTTRHTAKYVSVEHVGILDLKLKGYALEEQPSFCRTFKTGQILFAKRWAISTPYPSKIAIADFDGICSPHLWALETKDQLLQNLLPYILQSNTFFEHANRNSAGSLAGVYLKWEPFANYKFNLPPPEEQKQIASLFQSIDSAIEQVARQEKDLMAVQKSLTDGLIQEEPVFGTLLNMVNCVHTTFGNIADCDQNYPEHQKEVNRFVGLENIESDNFQLQGWGEISQGTTFTKRFVMGDVLFGKRRAYLKKVAVADFDGICSGDILVLRAKQGKMLQGLLPFYISSDSFIKYAVSTSAGSLSPRTKWKDLAKMKVVIPDEYAQEQILEVFVSIQTTKSLLKQQRITLNLLKQKLLNEILG
jgi:type I restriction enzyme, S subunit